MDEFRTSISHVPHRRRGPVPHHHHHDRRAGGQARRDHEAQGGHPLHYNDYSMCLSGLDDFKKAAAKSSGSTKFQYLAHGDTYQFSVNT
jgi:hypothetical protein